jgi:hypothetical protein
MAKFKVTVLGPDEDLGVDSVEIEFPRTVSERTYEQLLDDYMTLSHAEAVQLSRALRRALKKDETDG